MAQTAAPAAASPAAPELTPAERAKRDGDNVFRWILIHADKPKKPATPVAPATPAKDDKPAAVAKARPAARSAQKGDEAVADGAKAPASSLPTPSSTRPQATAAEAQARAQQPTNAAPAAAEPAPIETAKLSVPVEATPVAFATRAEPEPDDTLKLLERIEPRFPPNLLQALRKGQVRVGFTVLPDGSVSAPSVMSSSSTRLNTASLAAVTQWRFAPVRKPQAGVVDFVFDLD